MIELVIAMSVLSVGVLAVHAMFVAGIFQITRASTITTAASVASAEMENYHARTYDSIGLPESLVSGADGTYRGDTAFKTNASERVGCPGGGCPAVPTKTVSGADGRDYRVDTYMAWESGARDVKIVTIVVRDGASPPRVWARLATSFDQFPGT